jgi:hypothetical protein
MTLFEADLAVNTIRREVDANANIIFGSAFNENMKGKIRISVVATGIDTDDFKKDASKSQESRESSRFKIDPIQHNTRTTKSNSSVSGKNFFDLGSIANPVEEECEEISETDLKPKQSYLKEANPNYGVAENLDEQPANSAEAKFNQISFFPEEVEENIEEEVVAAKPTKQSPRKEKKETSSGGFSLFSFMNSSKKNEPKEEENEIQFVDIIPESDSKKSQILQNDQQIVSEEKSQEAAKKHQEFFGSTVFDDEEKEEKDERIEDDVLNVPAFFRRRNSQQ